MKNESIKSIFIGLIVFMLLYSTSFNLSRSGLIPTTMIISIILVVLGIVLISTGIGIFPGIVSVAAGILLFSGTMWINNLVDQFGLPVIIGVGVFIFIMISRLRQPPVRYYRR
jgi:hypothetical protein